MIRRALQNGLILALVAFLILFKAIELADDISRGEQPITYPSTAGR